MQNQSTIHIRPASLKDKDFIVSLLPRLTEFGPPGWREKNEMIKVDTDVIVDKLTRQPEGTAIFVAHDTANVPLGFIHLQSGDDYYNNEPHGHISDIIVAAEAEGKGVGSLLIKKAEEWARSLGYGWLTLNVFTQNHHAREAYERHGFREDTVKYVKVLE